jgi:hypothetical protein
LALMQKARPPDRSALKAFTFAQDGLRSAEDQISTVPAP